MEDRETARMRKYGESKTTGIMMATVPHVISGLGLRKFQADGFLLTRVYIRPVSLGTYVPDRTLSETRKPLIYLLVFPTKLLNRQKDVSLQPAGHT